MALLLHIIVALTSVVFTSYVFFRPAQSKLLVSYVLIGLTLLSGGYLVVSDPAQLLRACTSGLVYVTVVTAITVVAHKRLSRIIA